MKKIQSQTQNNIQHLKKFNISSKKEGSVMLQISKKYKVHMKVFVEKTFLLKGNGGQKKVSTFFLNSKRIT